MPVFIQHAPHKVKRRSETDPVLEPSPAARCKHTRWDKGKNETIEGGDYSSAEAGLFSSSGWGLIRCEIHVFETYSGSVGKTL